MAALLLILLVALQSPSLSPPFLLLLALQATGPTTGPFGNPAHQLDYYAKCMMGGILSCGLTHLAIVPLDVVKCRMQVSCVDKPGGAGSSHTESSV